jgi:hypothetical protein
MGLTNTSTSNHRGTEINHSVRFTQQLEPDIPCPIFRPSRRAQSQDRCANPRRIAQPQREALVTRSSRK